jgi:exodeoxyribonuclease III
MYADDWRDDIIRLAGILAPCAAAPAGAETLRVTSDNIWDGGAKEGKVIRETIAAIRAAGADVVRLHETRLESDPCTGETCQALGSSVAAALGWHVHDQTSENGALRANAGISRYPIGAASPNDLGVPLDVNGETAWLFNMHLDDEPYRPYQLLSTAYGPAPFIPPRRRSLPFPGPRAMTRRRRTIIRTGSTLSW